jgi:putative acetyltransferase
MSRVAERDGDVAGHILFSRGWLDAPRQLVEVSVLSPDEASRLCA